jgi:(4-O-methyl)-D-glucuronate---lignin esterase
MVAQAWWPVIGGTISRYSPNQRSTLQPEMYPVSGFLGVPETTIFKFKMKKAFLRILGLWFWVPLTAQPIPNQHDLPALLRSANGLEIKTTNSWEQIRRPEILHLFEHYMYGLSPGKPDYLAFKVWSVDQSALGGRAVRKQIAVYVDKDSTCKMNILLYLPKQKTEPVPIFVGLNFYGNQTISNDPGILITPNWVPSNEEFGIVDHRATEVSRGVRKSRWPVEMILERGYGLATIYNGDIDPDFDDGFVNGIHGLYAKQGLERDSSSWGTLSAWAWGLQRAMDYFETDKDVDKTRVAVIGHSRLGKAALWAGAQDKRFALVISNESGEGGAALSRNQKGESIADITSNFPHWFCGWYKTFADKVNELPLDQHMLLALIAPRPLYVASASEDLWSDPEGEYLSAYYAQPVYKLYRLQGLSTKNMPAVGRPAQAGEVGYHIRSGSHDLTVYDWEQFLAFADKHLKK